MSCKTFWKWFCCRWKQRQRTALTEQLSLKASNLRWISSLWFCKKQEQKTHQMATWWQTMVLTVLSKIDRKLAFPSVGVHNTDDLQRDIAKCRGTFISMTDCTRMCVHMFVLPSGRWSPPLPQQWSLPARSLLAAAGSPGPDVPPAGCWSGTRAPAGRGSTLTPASWSPSSLLHVLSPSARKQDNGECCVCHSINHQSNICFSVSDHHIVEA